MSLDIEPDSALRSLADAAGKVPGVVGIILFGSRARGEADAASDYDLLVLFESDATQWRHRRELYARIAQFGLFTQVLTRSLREWHRTEPTFHRRIIDEGRILFARYPFTPPIHESRTPNTYLVRYRLTRLPHLQKLRLEYHLFHPTHGMLTRLRGRRLGPGVLVIPTSTWDQLRAMLEARGVIFTIEPAQLHLPDT